MVKLSRMSRLFLTECLLRVIFILILRVNRIFLLIFQQEKESKERLFKRRDEGYISASRSRQLRRSRGSCAKERSSSMSRLLEGYVNSLFFKILICYQDSQDDFYMTMSIPGHLLQTAKPVISQGRSHFVWSRKHKGYSEHQISSKGNSWEKDSSGKFIK